MFEVCDLVFDCQFLAFQVLKDLAVRHRPVFFFFYRRFEFCMFIVESFHLLGLDHGFLLLNSKRAHETDACGGVFLLVAPAAATG